MIPNIGPLEIVIVLIIALIVFGPKRLPELGKSLGRGLNEFREGMSNIGNHDDDDEDEDDAEDHEPAELTPPPSDEKLPLPGEEPEVTEVTGSSDAEPVEGEVVPDSRD
ncbi:MAG TPA: twin-arginine translocase TatA/TatE family subunit [Solirubrobacterales bacterium]|jgi:sec-independent protein translocase protein TatA|nr:twin-arginine translocase TatA/TatE family subunit [Solirubrobacterales bacterium]HMU28309.1 twin-arginine translocase TatA/TatE family subunit [Solirubrobacterales bacterium]HMW44684.1 twin-arginine translocase TatA/TatE family subunit [Solirubrobacterales bacterium]HMX71195.1 twin-arginine translocase TatA/TatE family subunit [Solirubrobacterales bacterium]HMY25123.1 twin-arginine translocase TatA/TatE family subunit [Solirubrobacterales bacterium]